MIIKQLRRLLFSSISICLLTTMSCDSGTPEVAPELSISDYKAQITLVEDVANRGDASDIQISFTGGAEGSIISEYRLIAVPGALASTIDLESAKALGSNSFNSVVGGLSVYTEKLRANQEDFEGNAMIEGSSYKILILSVGTFNEEPVFILSEASGEVSMSTNPETSTLVNNLQANDALSIDAEGNIYASNYGTSASGAGRGTTVLKVTPSGQVSSFITGLGNPVGNAIDAEGNFYVNNDNNFAFGNLLKISPDGVKTTMATIQGYPAGLLLGRDGNFYVSNYSRGVVSKVSPDGSITEFATDDRLKGGVGIVYGNGDNILVANLISGDVLSIDSGGTVSLVATVPTTVPGSVIGYLTFFEGNVYATGGGARKVYKVSLAGEVTVFAGDGINRSVDGELLKASFTGPNGIVVDENKRVLYISDAGNGSAKLRVIPLD